MKNKFSIPPILGGLACAALLFSISGCARAPEAPPKTVQITANDKMKYDLTAFEVKPGQRVSVTLTNVGTTPKASMGHNFILLKQDTNVQKFLDEGSMHAAQDYIAPEFGKDVIANTRLLGPGESDTVTFVAPFVPGDYVYLCAFPAHYAAGMHGIMTVKQ
ncbi:MAG: plastocyanin/azurin family copper-binding protein [Chthoniobacterales bacterium]